MGQAAYDASYEKQLELERKYQESKGAPVLEEELNEITAAVGGMGEFQSLFVRVYLKECDAEAGTSNLEGHIPASSYINNNVLCLYTDSRLDVPLYFVPPPMVRFIEVIRPSGEYGIKLLNFHDRKINIIKQWREIHKDLRGGTLGLKDAKQLIESAPVILMEGLGQIAAEKAVTRLSGEGATVRLTHNGIEQN